jgi:hypothetical protein
MGQAKRRGTYEQRVEQAKQRNQMLMDRLAKTPPNKSHTFANRHGLQRLAMVLGMHLKLDPASKIPDTSGV